MVLYDKEFNVSASTTWSDIATVGIKAFEDTKRLSGLDRIDTAVNDPIAEPVRQYLTKNKPLTKSIRLLVGEGVIPLNVVDALNQIYE